MLDGFAVFSVSLLALRFMDIAMCLACEIVLPCSRLDLREFVVRFHMIDPCGSLRY